MSTNALTRTLQIAYPVTIFLAVLASAGMSLVQADSSDFKQLFPHNENQQLDRTLASSEASVCSINELSPRTQNPFCFQKTDFIWAKKKNKTNKN